MKKACILLLLYWSLSVSSQEYHPLIGESIQTRLHLPYTSKLVRLLNLPVPIKYTVQPAAFAGKV